MLVLKKAFWLWRKVIPVLKKKSYLFVDARYTLQANRESGKKFKIIQIHKTKPLIKDVNKDFIPAHILKNAYAYCTKTFLLR